MPHCMKSGLMSVFCSLTFLISHETTFMETGGVTPLPDLEVFCVFLLLTHTTLETLKGFARSMKIVIFKFKKKINKVEKQRVEMK